MTSVVSVENLTKRYGDITAVDGVSLEVRSGEVFGFLGPNGAGKTTTLRMLLGLVSPTSGRALVLGRAPGDPGALARVGALIEGPGLYPYLSGRSNLEIIARYAGVSRSAIAPALETVGLTDRADDKFAKYSLGMKQRLGVAAALLKDPELVILDEPTNGLDPQGMRDMRALVQNLGREGRTVILSSHLMSEVQQICSRVAVINNGRIVADAAVEELRGQSDLEVMAHPRDVARRTLEQLPEVASVRDAEGALIVDVSTRHTASVAAALVGAGVALTGLRRTERDLEDIFFDLTGADSREPELAGRSS
ncbi:ABC transporter ATP-binding protein [Knoellia subterranea]|uniref:ABC transporter ATP-binding protein n=1 Tax=Knoellia subterranea KCTC 19937 TaxID=1385521 RepID=A0A0A0JL00_9MICO|nr:ABC transporter ATP-binding protein [Knoellia subterranea]KGN38085.1 ABC transporter ATP-binding protein [Knoellia subterranea KCTC 19937]